MNTPNKLTVTRVILIPFFLCFLLFKRIHFAQYIIALLIFSVAAITDYFDGKIARERQLITNFGKLMDPLADKLLVISAFIAFIELGLIGAVPVIIIIAREFLVTSVRMIALENNTVIAANNWGKAKTVIQMISCIVILIMLVIETVIVDHFMDVSVSFSPFSFWFVIISQVLIWLCAAITFVSGMTYVLDNKKLFKDM